MCFIAQLYLANPLSNITKSINYGKCDVIKILYWWLLYFGMGLQYRNQHFIDQITKRIEKIRAEKGIVQEDIADRTGFTLKQVWRLLNGQHNFAISNIEAIANALQVHPRELFDFDFELVKHYPTRKERKAK